MYLIIFAEWQLRGSHYRRLVDDVQWVWRESSGYPTQAKMGNGNIIFEIRPGRIGSGHLRQTRYFGLSRVVLSLQKTGNVFKGSCYDYG